MTSKTFLDLGFFPAAKPKRFANDPAGIAALVEALSCRGVGKVALEAVGTYARGAVCAIVGAGLSVFLVDPSRIRALRTAEGLIAKTDRLDAGLIARFAARMSEHLRPAPDDDQIALKALSTRRRQLTEMIAMKKTRLALALDPLVATSHGTVIKTLETACAAVEAELDQRIAAVPALARASRVLIELLIH